MTRAHAETAALVAMFISNLRHFSLRFDSLKILIVD
jgi:hypothetical protein